MPTVQRLTFHLDGITAGDYLAYVRDPEPPGLDTVLRSISADADPLGDTIDFVLAWKDAPPVPAVAAVLAGLPVTPEVVVVDCPVLAAAA
jgi:hypothetical protein